MIRDQPGTYGSSASERRIYTPPEGKKVIREHLSRWERFLHADHGLDPLTVMALAHYQFEAIHPFFDGNGRTGRVLNLLILIETELLEFPILYLSGHIMRHKDTYYERLNAVIRSDDWEPWVLFMMVGVELTAHWTMQLVDATGDLRGNMEEEIRQLNTRMPATEITRLLCTQPYLRIENVVDAGLAKRQTASKWLGDLAEAGLITKERVGRHVIYVNDRLLYTLFHTPLPGHSWVSVTSRDSRFGV